jgi:hypothetical protein
VRECPKGDTCKSGIQRVWEVADGISMVCPSLEQGSSSSPRSVLKPSSTPSLKRTPAIIVTFGKQATRSGQPAGGQLLNVIHSISPKDPAYAERPERGYALLRDAGFFKKPLR